jgi:hypothetical protein
MGTINQSIKAYVLSLDVETDFEVHATAIQNWMSYEQQHNKLHPDAERFISVCESLGDVYTLYGFVSFLNFDSASMENSYIYLTKNY